LFFLFEKATTKAKKRNKGGGGVKKKRERANVKLFFLFFCLSVLLFFCPECAPFFVCLPLKHIVGGESEEEMKKKCVF